MEPEGPASKSPNKLLVLDDKWNECLDLHLVSKIGIHPFQEPGYSYRRIPFHIFYPIIYILIYGLSDLRY